MDARRHAEKFSGMYEASTMLPDVEWRLKTLLKRVLLAANVAPIGDYGGAVSTAEELYFSGQMMHSKLPVLIAIKGT